MGCVLGYGVLYCLLVLLSELVNVLGEMLFDGGLNEKSVDVLFE